MWLVGRVVSARGRKGGRRGDQGSPAAVEREGRRQGRKWEVVQKSRAKQGPGLTGYRENLMRKPGNGSLHAEAGEGKGFERLGLGDGWD